MKLMIILQGPPGSGKSTEAQRLATAFANERLLTAIVSADNHHIVDGVYQFDPKKVQQAHAAARDEADRACRNGLIVVVDNTNIRAWEARPYVEMAMQHGYVVAFRRCHGRHPNVHGVATEKVDIMRDRMEDLTVERCLEATGPHTKTASPVQATAQ